MRIRTKKSEVKVEIKRDGETGTVWGVPQDPQDQEALRKKFTTYERVGGQTIPQTDHIGLQIAKAQAVFKRWDFEDENGEPLPVNDDNVAAVYMLNRSVVNEALNKFDEIGRGAVKLTTPAPLQDPAEREKAVEGN